MQWHAHDEQTLSCKHCTSIKGHERGWDGTLQAKSDIYDLLLLLGRIAATASDNGLLLQ